MDFVNTERTILNNILALALAITAHFIFCELLFQAKQEEYNDRVLGSELVFRPHHFTFVQKEPVLLSTCQRDIFTSELRLELPSLLSANSHATPGGNKSDRVLQAINHMHVNFDFVI